MTEVKEIKMNEIDKDEIRVAMAIFTKALHDIVERASSRKGLLMSVEGAGMIVADFYMMVINQMGLPEDTKAYCKKRFLLEVEECLNGGLDKFLKDHETKESVDG